MNGSSGRMLRRWAAVLLAFALIGTACSDDGDAETSETTAAPDDTAAETTAAVEEPLVFGMILVGPRDDRGWSQAHFEAGEYLEEKVGAEMLVVDLVNPADKPEVTVEQIVDDMVSEGARLIFATSDDMKDGIQLAAEKHPDVPMIWSSGDSAWVEGEAYREDLTNLGNIMGQMEIGKAIAGCAAALTTDTGQIAYLGPLINDETRRLVAAAYLGARHCWESEGNDPADLGFKVTWIGFWFQIPGVTLDPTQVVNEFYDGGADVVISGIDTTEAIVRAGQRAAAGETVWAIPYDFEGACAEAEEVCLGVPYFNWGPSYLDVAIQIGLGNFTPQFQWLGPDWTNINDRDTSHIGWVTGSGLSAENSDKLTAFMAALASGSVEIFRGPLNYQDGTPFLADGETATPQQIWYLPQLLEGIEGASSS